MTDCLISSASRPSAGARDPRKARCQKGAGLCSNMLKQSGGEGPCQAYRFRPGAAQRPAHHSCASGTLARQRGLCACRTRAQQQKRVRTGKGANLLAPLRACSSFALHRGGRNPCKIWFTFPLRPIACAGRENPTRSIRREIRCFEERRKTGRNSRTSWQMATGADNARFRDGEINDRVVRMLGVRRARCLDGARRHVRWRISTRSPVPADQRD